MPYVFIASIQKRIRRILPMFYIEDVLPVENKTEIHYGIYILPNVVLGDKIKIDETTWLEKPYEQMEDFIVKEIMAKIQTTKKGIYYIL